MVGTYVTQSSNKPASMYVATTKSGGGTTVKVSASSAGKANTVAKKVTDIIAKNRASQGLKNAPSSATKITLATASNAKIALPKTTLSSAGLSTGILSAAAGGALTKAIAKPISDTIVKKAAGGILASNLGKAAVVTGTAYAVGKGLLGLGEGGGLVGAAEKALGINIPGLGYSASQLRRKRRRRGVHIYAGQIRTINKVHSAIKRMDKVLGKIGYDVKKRVTRVLSGRRK